MTPMKNTYFLEQWLFASIQESQIIAFIWHFSAEMKQRQLLFTSLALLATVTNGFKCYEGQGANRSINFCVDCAHFNFTCGCGTIRVTNTNYKPVSYIRFCTRKEERVGCQTHRAIDKMEHEFCYCDTELCNAPNEAIQSRIVLPLYFVSIVCGVLFCVH